MPAPRVIISGGGTGGHIFPAIAIAQGIQKEYPDAEIMFVGATGKMEMEKVPQAGYPIEGLWIIGLQRKLTLKNLAFPFKVVSSLMKSRKIIRKFKPDLAVGVGGFASGPLLRAATGMGVKTLIQEQNSFPGITNKLLAKRVDKICVAYEGLERWFPAEKITLTGNPIRQQVVQIEGKKEQAKKHFGLDPNKPVIFAMGGSLGARTINESLAQLADEIPSWEHQLLWQTGKLFIEQAADISAQHTDIHAFEFIREMDLAYAAADIIVSRAGAMSISELCLIGKPVILIPFPYAAEDHQTKNAQALVDKQAAILIADSECRHRLRGELQTLIGDTARQNEMGKNILTLGQKDASSAIIDQIKALIQQ